MQGALWQSRGCMALTLWGCMPVACSLCSALRCMHVPALVPGHSGFEKVTTD